MKYIKNENGIALVTALLITLISLAIIMAVVYFVTQGTKVSSLEKRYKTALEASHGGLEVITKDIIPQTIGGTAITSIISALPPTYKSMFVMNPGLPDVVTCFTDKMTKSTVDWAAGCSTTITDVKTTYDFRVTLNGIAPQPNFTAYTKIVDSVKGNTDTSGLILEGTGVVESGSGVVTPQHFPYTYRIEVQGERQNNPDERANLSALYAY